jgi:hypothetical protein
MNGAGPAGGLDWNGRGVFGIQGRVQRWFRRPFFSRLLTVLTQLPECAVDAGTCRA